MKPVVGKTQEQVIAEWGRIAKLRIEQIEDGKDLSFKFVLAPCIFDLSKPSNFENVIDLGCGVGFLTKELAQKARYIVGVDMSRESVNVTLEQCSNLVNVEVVNATIEEYVSSYQDTLFSLAIANMTLMTVLDLDTVVEAIAKILRPGGHFVFTITHPCFWPFYWKYAFEEWFNYKKEITIEAPFKTSLATCNGLVTTHVHRPLERYTSSLIKAGFVIDKVMEPLPNKTVETKYPTRWEYPRFLGMRCIRK